jgi:lysophospholipase L1-like esterase
VIKNEGIDGDTLGHICDRLKVSLRFQRPDVIVLQGGYNDLILPTFQQRGLLFRLACKQQLKKGLVPMESAEELEEKLRETTRYVKANSNAKIVLLTIGCIGEKTDHPLQQKRQLFNTVIRSVAAEEKIALADCGTAFDNYLGQGFVSSSYLLQSFWSIVLKDRIASKQKGGTERLSRNRGLQLTIDGVHLNEKGAALFCEEVVKAVNSLKMKGEIIS